MELLAFSPLIFQGLGPQRTHEKELLQHHPLAQVLYSYFYLEAKEIMCIDSTLIIRSYAAGDTLMPCLS